MNSRSSFQACQNGRSTSSASGDCFGITAPLACGKCTRRVISLVTGLCQSFDSRTAAGPGSAVSVRSQRLGVQMTDSVDAPVEVDPTPREQRRLEIQAIAARLFNERGYDAVSIRDLAQAAGVSLGTLYWYMDNKQSLLQAIYDSIFDELYARIRRVGTSDLDPEAKLRAFMFEGCELRVRRRDESMVYTHERNRLGAAYANAIPRIEEMDDYVKAALSAGVARGLWPATNTLAARMAIWSVITFITEWFQDDGELTVSQMADQFADLVIGGLRRGEQT